LTYLADTNIFLRVRQRDYPPDVFPNLWEHFCTQCEQSHVVSIDRVRDELAKFEDASKLFFEDNFPDEYLIYADQHLDAYRSVQDWAIATGDRFKQKALDDFAVYEAADPWLVAVAKDLDYVVLTAETSEPARRTRIKIPDACIACDVACVDFVSFLRETGYKG